MRVGSPRDLAVAVRGRRTDLGLSQAVLAERAHVSRKWIYEFEAGKPAAELGLLLRVLEVLELTVDVSTSGDTGPTSQPAAGTNLDDLLDEYRGP